MCELLLHASQMHSCSCRHQERRHSSHLAFCPCAFHLLVTPGTESLLSQLVRNNVRQLAYALVVWLQVNLSCKHYQGSNADSASIALQRCPTGFGVPNKCSACTIYHVCIFRVQVKIAHSALQGCPPGLGVSNRCSTGLVQLGCLWREAGRRSTARRAACTD